MDHKEVIPASYQEYDDKFEDPEEEDRYEEEDDPFFEEVEEESESLTTTSDPGYTPLLPDEEEGVDFEEEMESLEEVACPFTPLLPVRQRDKMYFSEDERPGNRMTSIESNEIKEEEREEEERKEEEEAMEEDIEQEEEEEDDMLDLVIPLVSIVITQPTPEIERRTLEGWLEEQEDEDDEDDLEPGDDDEEKREEFEEDKENICLDSELVESSISTVGSNTRELCQEASASVPVIIVTPVTPELNQKVFGACEEIETDEKDEEGKEREETIRATPETPERSQVKIGISFREDVKAEEDDDKDGGKGGARMKRRSSLFSTVTKATSILRYPKSPHPRPPPLHPQSITPHSI